MMSVDTIGDQTSHTTYVNYMYDIKYRSHCFPTFVYMGWLGLVGSIKS